MDAHNEKAAELSEQELEQKAMKDAAEAVSAARAKLVMLKALPTMAAAIRAPMCPAKGLLIGVPSYTSMTSSLKARKRNQKMLAALLSPLKSVVTLAQRAIRRPEGVIVTNSIQEQLREALAWQVEQCVVALHCQYPETAKDAAYSDTMRASLAYLRKKLGATANARPRPRPASSSSSFSSSERSRTSGTRSCSSSSSPSDNAAAASADRKRDAAKKKHAKNAAPLCPGAAFVPAHRPTVRVDPRARHIIRSGAVCR